MEKFYNENTEFLDDIILDISDIQYNISNTNSNVEEKKISIVITKLIKNEYIQYSEQDFKNNLVILFKDNNFNIKLINNLYTIFNKIDNKKLTQDFKFTDENLHPVIFINKKFYINENDGSESESNNTIYDELFRNNNRNLIKLNFDNYLTQRENILENPYKTIQNQLYNLDKPFEDNNENILSLDLYNYIPTFDRDALSNCIFSKNLTDSSNENNDDINATFDTDNQCVNFNNDPINLETFRIISPKTITFNKTTIDLYNGDNVKIIGYVNKIPTLEDEYKIYDIDKYFDDVNAFVKNDKITIYFNIKLSVTQINGKINSIKNNKIEIKLNEKILIENISTKVLIYDTKSNDNDFYIFPINEQQIYYKNLLKDNIIAFKFSKVNFEKSSKFILPNIYQLISYYDNILNYNNVKKLLFDNHFNIENLNETEISLIHSKLDINITEIENISEEKLKKKQFDFKKINPSLSKLINFDNIPDEYIKYPNFIKDTEQNRYLYLTSTPDLGYIHFLNKLKLKIEEDYKEIKDYDYENDLTKFNKEKIVLEESLKKFKDNDCKQIKIETFFNDLNEFQKTQGDQKYNDKYVVLIQQNVSVLYLMQNGNWEKLTIIDSINEIKICNGESYYEKIKENKCVYDDVKKLCEKRDFIQLRNKFEIIKQQINVTKDLKTFEKDYKKYVNIIDETINKQKQIINNEFKYGQNIYKKKKILNKYIGNEDYIDFSQQFDNIDSINIGTYNPLSSTIEEQNPYKDTKNFLLIEKILNHIGFELNLNEKIYIIESMDFLATDFFNKKIKSLIKNSNNLTVEKIIKKMKNENKYYPEKDKINLLIIASLITIIIQIQFPNVELVKIYNKCDNIFSTGGFPRYKDEGDKQLYKYIVCVLSEEFEYNLNDEGFKRIINYTLDKKPFLKNTLDGKTDIEVVNNNKNSIWTGFKPELNMTKDTTNLISKYLYDINNIIKKSKILNFNVFKKPFISNICCLEKVDKNINYYNLIKNKIDYSDYNKKFKNNIVNNLIINEVFSNIINNNIYANFDNINIFTKDDIVSFSNIDTFKIKKNETDYYNFNDKILNIINNQNNIQIKTDETLKDVIKNFDINNSWFKFSTKIDNIFNKIMTFTKNNSNILTDNIIDDLYSYFITLEIDDISNLKRILQKFVSTKISSIINKIKNYNVINKVINKPYLSEYEIFAITEIIEKDSVNKFISNIQDLDTFKDFNFDIILNNINCDVLNINIPNNSNSNPDIDNLTKNIYILNYIFLNIILYIYSSLLYENPTLFNNENILDELEQINLTNTNDNFKIIADIVSFIFKEFRDTINTNLVPKETLQSKMDKLREERKDMKLNKFQKLDVDEADTMKLLKDIVGIEYNYEEDKTNTEFIPEEIVEINNDDIVNQQEVNENYTNYINDYQGENADNENDYDDSHR